MAKRERDYLPHKENGFYSSDFCLAPITMLMNYNILELICISLRYFCNFAKIRISLRKRLKKNTKNNCNNIAVDPKVVYHFSGEPSTTRLSKAKYLFLTRFRDSSCRQNDKFAYCIDFWATLITWIRQCSWVFKSPSRLRRTPPYRISGRASMNSKKQKSSAPLQRGGGRRPEGSGRRMD